MDLYQPLKHIVTPAFFGLTDPKALMRARNAIHTHKPGNKGVEGLTAREAIRRDVLQLPPECHALVLMMVVNDLLDAIQAQFELRFGMLGVADSSVVKPIDNHLVYAFDKVIDAVKKLGPQIREAIEERAKAGWPEWDYEKGSPTTVAYATDSLLLQALADLD